jgi:hypothetical protein
VRTKRAGALALGAVLFVAVVAACGGDDDSATPAKKSTTTTEKPPVAPLTGRPDKSGASASRSALAVKIDNVNLSSRQPQAGLDVADVVYEEPVEPPYTRFVAIFQSQAPDRVGDVRSTRFIDPMIVWNLGGMYVYSGGTPPKVAAIRAAPIESIDENGLVARNAHIRDPNIKAPYNLFAIPSALWASAKDKNPPAPLFTYGNAKGGTPANVVDIPNPSKAHYEWDAAKHVWLRSELLGGNDETVQPHIAASGKRIAPTNLIVQKIGDVESADSALGTGEAWVLTNGKVVHGTWERASREDRTVFLDASGSEVPLRPGTTWVHLVTEGAPTVG